MSISTQGGEQQHGRPSVVSTGGKAPGGGKSGGKPGAGRAGQAGGTKAGAGQGRPGGTPPRAGGKGTGGKGAGGRGPGGKGPGGRKPLAPVKVNQGRNWGPIALFVAVGVIALGIVGYAAFAVIKGTRTWDERVADITGLTNYREQNPALLEPPPGQQSHVKGPVTYAVVPPVGGSHNENWQNCMGDVYPAQIANEHAVHSLEHGAVWITYDPSLPAAEVDKLAARVRGKDHLMMSPFPGLNPKISLQAWGFQLKVADADDGRIDEFITALRINASIEGPTALCSGGITATGTTPRDI